MPPPGWGTHSFEGISLRGSPLPGKAMKLFLFTSPQTLSPIFSSVSEHRGRFSFTVTPSPLVPACKNSDCWAPTQNHWEFLAMVSEKSFFKQAICRNLTCTYIWEPVIKPLAPPECGLWTSSPGISPEPDRDVASLALPPLPSPGQICHTAYFHRMPRGSAYTMKFEKRALCNLVNTVSSDTQERSFWDGCSLKDCVWGRF